MNFEVIGACIKVYRSRTTIRKSWTEHFRISIFLQPIFQWILLLLTNFIAYILAIRWGNFWIKWICIFWSSERLELFLLSKCQLKYLSSIKNIESSSWIIIVQTILLKTKTGNTIKNGMMAAHVNLIFCCSFLIWIFLNEFLEISLWKILPF